MMGLPALVLNSGGVFCLRVAIISAYNAMSLMSRSSNASRSVPLKVVIAAGFATLLLPLFALAVGQFILMTVRPEGAERLIREATLARQLAWVALLLGPVTMVAAALDGRYDDRRIRIARVFIVPTTLFAALLLTALMGIHSALWWLAWLHLPDVLFYFLPEPTRQVIREATCAFQMYFLLPMLGGISLVSLPRFAWPWLSSGIFSAWHVIGVPAQRESLLWKRVAEIATFLGTPLPEDVIIGNGLGFFSSPTPVRHLDGTTSGPALYLSLPLIRVMTPGELDAFIGHELWHLKSNEEARPGRRMAAPDKTGPVWRRSLGTANRWFDLALERMVVVLPCMYLDRAARGIKVSMQRRMPQEIEFACDQAGIRVSHPEVFASALAKLGLCTWVAPQVESEAEQAVRQRTQLDSDSEWISRQLVAACTPELIAQFPSSALAAESDSHPSFAQRLKKINVPIHWALSNVTWPSPIDSAALFAELEPMDRRLTLEQRRQEGFAQTVARLGQKWPSVVTAYAMHRSRGEVKLPAAHTYSRKHASEGDMVCVYPSRRKLILLALIYLLGVFVFGGMAALSIGLSLHLDWAHGSASSSAGSVGYGVLGCLSALLCAYFGYWALYMAWRAITRRPAFTLTSVGIIDQSLPFSPGLVRWTEVDELYVARSMSATTFYILPKDFDAVINRREGSARFWLRLNRRIKRREPFSVPGFFLPMPVYEFHALVCDYYLGLDRARPAV